MSRYHHSCMAVTLLWLACGGTCFGAAPVEVRPGSPIPILAGSQNLVPNASFECGTDGWGSAELEPARLVRPAQRPVRPAGLDTAADGRSSLRIELTPENQPVAYNDYLHVERQPIKAPLAANIGWIAVEPGKRYTFSVAMKAAEAGTPARLVVRQFRAAPVREARAAVDRVGTLHAGVHRRRPRPATCWPVPTCGKTEDNPIRPRRATVWLDAVQLAQPTRRPVCHAPAGRVRHRRPTSRATSSPGTSRCSCDVTVASADAQEERKAEIELRLTDFFDEEVWRDDSRSVSVPAGVVAGMSVAVPPSPQRRGYLRLHATMTSGTTVEQRTMRLAAIPVYTPCGLAFRHEPRLRLAGAARSVPPGRAALDARLVAEMAGRGAGEGAVHFTETDAQIDRLLRQDLKVLGVLAFPSTMWSSSAPADVQPPDPWYPPIPSGPTRNGSATTSWPKWARPTCGWAMPRAT